MSERPPDCPQDVWDAWQAAHAVADQIDGENGTTHHEYHRRAGIIAAAILNGQGLMQARIDHLHSALETIKLQGDEHSRAIADVALFGRDVVFTAEQNREAWADWDQWNPAPRE
jgi:hypothetical protein